jgi:hypothetical protein
MKFVIEERQKEKLKGWEEGEKEVISYWMNSKGGEVTGNYKRKP